MKTKIKSVISSAAVLVLTVPALVMAQVTQPSGTNLPTGTITGIVKNAMNWLLQLVGYLGVIGFAIAGILYLTAAGDDDRIAIAKKAMTWSIVGVVVALLGLVVLGAVTSMLGGTTTNF